MLVTARTSVPRADVSQHTDAQQSQDNILIRGGRVCLSEFGIAGAFPCFGVMTYELKTLRYMAPERCSWGFFPDLQNKVVFTRLQLLLLRYVCLSRTMLPLDIIISYHGQVLTGILSYSGREHVEIYLDITNGVRPSRPTDPRQNRWLPDPIWNVIAAGWQHEPRQRCRLSVMSRVFLAPSRRDAQGVEPGDLNAQNN